jgi:hypothetical protein
VWCFWLYWCISLWQLFCNTLHSLTYRMYTILQPVILGKCHLWIVDMTGFIFDFDFYSFGSIFTPQVKMNRARYQPQQQRPREWMVHISCFIIIYM